MIIKATQNVEVNVTDEVINGLVRNKILSLMFGPNCRYYLSDWIRVDGNNVTLTDCCGITTVIKEATEEDKAYVTVLEKLV